jgi:hypothetical protein
MKCIQALRQIGWPDPTAATFTFAYVDVTSGVVAIGTSAATPVLTESHVCIIYANGFMPGASSRSTVCRALFDLWRQTKDLYGGDPGDVFDYLWTIDEDNTSQPTVGYRFITLGALGALDPIDLDGNTLGTHISTESSGFWLMYNLVGTPFPYPNINSYRTTFSANGTPYDIVMTWGPPPSGSENGYWFDYGAVEPPLHADLQAEIGNTIPMSIEIID